MSRIKLEDTQMGVIMKMSEGNPGAVTAMMEILNKGTEIDPQAFLGGLGAIMILDTWGIYGTDIYVLYSDKCGRDVRKMLMLMRATQLGIFSEERLKQMAADQACSINLSDEEFKELDDKVCDRLPDFARVD